ncbi:hypothetical protein NP552_18820 [Pseudomonas sp. 8209]|uniref:hypothetical protein n=1 Tax=Pseudomonas sp. 8209 TaxID=2967214 RepID=UPI002364381B|nr:hypothetical protein [Pseudomonas sp. 8209]MDD1957094.1 hypothetical protein [Pseudomonas sp. 8209]
MINLAQLISWLGVEGAKAGLDKSDLTISEILDLTPGDKPPQTSKTRRSEAIEMAIELKRKELYKSPEELMEMDIDTLKLYFSDYRFSRQEILSLLETLDIRPSGEARKKLNDFAAREISEIGRFRRVANGKTSFDPSNKK